MVLDNVKKKLRMCDKCTEMQTFLSEVQVKMNLFKDHIQPDASDLQKP